MVDLGILRFLSFASDYSYMAPCTLDMIFIIGLTSILCVLLCLSMGHVFYVCLQ